MISEIWLKLIEAIYIPLYRFFGYQPFISLIVWVLFTAMQIWVFWHFFFKPYIYVCKMFFVLINKNSLFKEVEVDEKSSQKYR